MKDSEKPLTDLDLESMPYCSSLILLIYSIGYIDTFIWVFAWKTQCIIKIGHYKNDKTSQVKLKKQYDEYVFFFHKFLNLFFL